MAEEKLSTLLQYTLPPLQAYPPPEDNNNLSTSNAAYPPDHITGISRWVDFDITTIFAIYGDVLREARLPSNPVMQAPHPVLSKTSLAHRVTQYIMPQMMTALDCAFRYELTNNPSANWTPTTMDVGDTAHYVDGFIPDLAIYQNSGSDHRFETRPFNRVPGAIRPSWEWNWDMQNGTQNQQKGFKQVLSQVRKYMDDNGRCRYGFILTDRELVAIKRNDNSGHTYISDPISWSRQGNREDPVLTPLLALWYLGMLAANDNGPHAWSF